MVVSAASIRTTNGRALVRERLHAMPQFPGRRRGAVELRFTIFPYVPGCLTTVKSGFWGQDPRKLYDTR